MKTRMVMFSADVRHSENMIDFLDYLRSEMGLDVRVMCEDEADRVCIAYPDRADRPSIEQQVDGLF